MMFSIIIRNKNESEALQRMLPILIGQYSYYFNEIILIDNNSTDDSVKVAKYYNCRIEYICQFSYGRSINLGMSYAINNYVLLLSAHAMPIGQSFFKTALKKIDEHDNVAGLRFINSFENFEYAFKNNFITKEEPIKNGLMNACSVINKNIWELYKFDENLPACEDKEWSMRVIENNFKIIQVPETFFYFPKRGNKGILRRHRIEKTAEMVIKREKPMSYLKILGVSIYSITIKNIIRFFKNITNEIRLLGTRLAIRRDSTKYYRS